MIYLKQNDIRWGSTKMLPSNITIARVGCLLTCMCMLSDYYGEFTLPNQAVNTTVFFTPDATVDWTQLNWSKFKLEERIRYNDPAKIFDSIKTPKKSVCLNINNGGHWVVAIAKMGPYYKVVDPWTGKTRIINQKEVVGSANFIQI